MQIKDIEWNIESVCNGQDTLNWYCSEDGQRITVLERTTGFSFAPFDIETGYRDVTGKFWLASGNFDIRQYSDLTIDEAIAKIKQHANTCVGV